MFDLGWTELLVIGVVALIVVGPKDLPVLFRNAGQFIGKIRGMAREFTSAMNDAADESGVKGMAADLRKMSNPMDAVRDAAKSATDFTKDLNLDPKSETGKLSAERLAAKKKIEAASARKAAERKAREADDALQKAAELEADLDNHLEPDPAPESPKT
jgi:sec-independent protein translocase protein TatB